MPRVIPFVASRSTEVGPLESDLAIEVTPKEIRIAYRMPTRVDRDAHGNLWARMTEVPGSSRVQYDSMHSERQRKCMEEMLCQVCAEPADRDKQGWLFFDWQREESPPTWPEKSITAMPPLCVPCARLSAQLCPFLRGTEYVVLRARKANLYGVAGTVYTVDKDGWHGSEYDVLSPNSKPRIPGLLASRLYRELRGVTVVDLP